MFRPKIIINFAMTFDAKVSTAGGTASNFTSAEDKKRLLAIRSLGDAVMVGRTTAERDHMSLGLPEETLRNQRLARNQAAYPLRVLVSNSGEISDSLELFKHAFSPILIYSSEQMAPERRSQLGRKAEIRLSKADPISIPWMLEDLSENRRIRTLVCEGGPTLVRGLAEIDAIDEIFLTIAPKLFGGKSAPGLLGSAGAFMPKTRTYRLIHMETLNNECYLRYARA